jgi:hypothetical protein
MVLGRDLAAFGAFLCYAVFVVALIERLPGAA